MRPRPFCSAQAEGVEFFAQSAQRFIALADFADERWPFLRSAVRFQHAPDVGQVASGMLVGGAVALIDAAIDGRQTLYERGRHKPRPQARVTPVPTGQLTPWLAGGCFYRAG